ncbi:hypothetical protein RN346_04470 [Halomonas sp. PAMB 3232]|uniref:hypothetical protein n=1 Tax=Halomonas sp. PAMB 3232 TaxID=3075221 RepID=UPI002899F326|nr:hypothetical protein [Halomonas sp. PAMB 3232]WNL39816.1 hypothetical protein RN346_04470 [Halomonas sp. PAMB 3232]
MMLKPELVKEILQMIGDGEYVGTPLGDLYKHFLNEDIKGASENEFQKFVYHMDELFDAELFKTRNLNAQRRWGKSQSVGGSRSYANVPLVLTPLGGEVLKELNKPKGLERLMQGIRSAGSAAGQEALKYGVKELFRGALGS